MQTSEEINELNGILFELDRAGGTRSAFVRTVGQILSDCIQYVIDDSDGFNDLLNSEKTYVGTKLEKRILNRYQLPRKRKKSIQRLDTIIYGLDVDIKHSFRNKWMVPREAVGYWCLGVMTHYHQGRFSVGLLKMLDERLTSQKGIQDKKRSPTAEAMKLVKWLGKDVLLPPPTQTGTVGSCSSCSRTAA